MKEGSFDAGFFLVRDVSPFTLYCQARPKCSSFYLASCLLSLFQKDKPLASQLKIHIYDRLWALHRLVRYGVAPDHPAIKVRFLSISPRLSFKRPCHFTPELHAQV
jgi:hypothetical protein